MVERGRRRDHWPPGFAPAHGSYNASKFALEALSEVLAQVLKTFNVRVAIVEPGIIGTPIFEKLVENPPDSRYPHEGRLRAVHSASLRNPVSPFVVAEAVRQVIESDSWQLRYPVGPDAVPLLQWRASMTDEEWVDCQSVPDDDTYYAQVARDLGIDARPFRRVRSVARGV